MISRRLGSPLVEDAMLMLHSVCTPTFSPHGLPKNGAGTSSFSLADLITRLQQTEHALSA